jgi:hypothetical protein
MDKKLITIFNEFGIMGDEIENLIQLCPGLQIVDASKVYKCINILINAGFPKDDVSSLIYINPSFMMYQPVDLDEKLKSIGGDIEEKLKNDPFII